MTKTFANQQLQLLRVENVIPAKLDYFMRQRFVQEMFEAWFKQQVSQLSEEERIWMGVISKQTQVQAA